MLHALPYSTAHPSVPDFFFTGALGTRTCFLARFARWRLSSSRGFFFENVANHPQGPCMLKQVPYCVSFDRTLEIILFWCPLTVVTRIENGTASVTDESREETCMGASRKPIHSYANNDVVTLRKYVLYMRPSSNTCSCSAFGSSNHLRRFPRISLHACGTGFVGT
jgi:hypothetical protein